MKITMKRVLVLALGTVLTMIHAYAAAPSAQFTSGNFNFRVPASKTAASSNLVVIIHGYGTAEWPVYTELESALSTKLGAGWNVRRYIWDGDATLFGPLWPPNPNPLAEVMPEVHAQNLAKWIRQQKSIGNGYRHVQFIGSSLGSRVAHAATVAVSQMKTWSDGGTDRVPTVHEYFADPWIIHGWHLTYGQNANFADCGIYYRDEAGTNTDISILRARNYNINYYRGDGMSDPGYIPWVHSNHDRPMFWYRDTVVSHPPAAPVTNRGFAFDLNKANNAPWPGDSPDLWAAGKLVTVTNDAAHPTDHHYDHITRTKDLPVPVKLMVQEVDPNAQKITGDYANATFTSDSVTLHASSSGSPNYAYASFNVNFGAGGGNCLDFSHYFTSSGDGKLEVFMDNNSGSYKLVTALRESFASGTASEPQWSGDLMLDPNNTATLHTPALLTGAHKLSFRLDRTWSSANSTLVISNISLSLMAACPVISTFARAENGTVTLTGAATAGEYYVLRCAPGVTSPMTWTALATNRADGGGVFSFTDSGASNHLQRLFCVTPR